MTEETVVAMSISEIVSTALDETSDPWRLSLVQRDLVWTETQVRYLLDSLIFGYPIGSLLLCKVSHGGAVLERRGDARHAAPAGDDVWQLLDGQQRVSALVRLFTPPDDAAQPRFLLSLTQDRDVGDVVERRSKVDRSLRYVQCVRSTEDLEPRWKWLDVSGAHAALRDLVRAGAGAIAAVLRTDEDTLDLAYRIDGRCTRELWAQADDRERTCAVDRIRRLVRAYTARAVPVVRLALDSPIDVLQVFTRVNRTGVQVAGEDVFFAAVKTLWRDAEESLHRFQTAVPFLSRSSALRLVARCASRDLGAADPIPLDVERLNGQQGRELVRRMEALTTEGSVLLERAAFVAEVAIRRSGLGHALRHLPQSLFDPVFAWAAARQVDSLDESALAPAWAFVLGATAFGYRTTFGPAFERIAFERAHAAGQDGAAFPLQAITARAHEKWPNLSRSRRTVRGIESEEERRALVNDNCTTFMLIAQAVPFELPTGLQLDWEHLFPTARGEENLRWKGADGERRLQRHPDSWCISRAGNLMALDARLNRSAGMGWPDQKLEQYRGASHWPPDLFLSADEERTLREACAALREKRVPDGAGLLARYVRERELRAYEAVTARFPAMLMFANGKPGGPLGS